MKIREFWLSLVVLLCGYAISMANPTGDSIPKIADPSAIESPQSEQSLSGQPVQDAGAAGHQGSRDKETSKTLAVPDMEFPIPQLGVVKPLSKSQEIAFAQIEVLESARRKERSVWRPLLAHADNVVVQQTLRSMGRVQSLDLLGLIESRLGSESPKLRLEAAFAYGQTPQASTAPLAARLEQETNVEVKRRLIEAISKLGSIADLGTLTGLAQANNPGVRSAALIAMAVIAHRSKSELLGLDRVWKSFPDSNQSMDLRFAWAYLAMRARKNNQPDLLNSLASCLKDSAPSVRAPCTRALGRFGAGSAEARRSAMDDPNWRVQIASIRADLESKDLKLLILRLSQLRDRLRDESFRVTGAQLNVTLTLISALSALPPAEETAAIEKEIYAVTLAGSTEEFVLSRAHINCAAASMIDRRRGRPKLTESCGTSLYPTSRRNRWMVRVTTGLKQAPRLATLTRMYPRLDVAGKLAVLESLTTMAKSPKISKLLIGALSGQDPALAGTAADVGARLQVKELVPVLMEAYQRFYERRHFETVQSIFSAFGQLKAEESHGILNRHNNDSHPGVRHTARQSLKAVDLAIRNKMTAAGRSAAFLPGRRSFLPPPAESFGVEKPDTQIVKRSKYNEAVLKTNKGDIRIKLYLADARETVKNFTSLAERKYYDGLSFHRVVPAFIIQAGDPKATGWGGPGYTIPCEVHPQPFERGTVGMALSGKDTGGGQFFITHDRSPHLNGRYTVFGQVVDGQSVVDAISEGDQISSVELRYSK